MPPVGQPVNLGELRQALIDRCYLDANDPRLDTANLNRYINEAVQRFDVAHPNGWPWDFVTTTVTLTAGTNLLTGAPGISGFPHKVAWMLVGDTALSWQYPIERLTREEQLDRYPQDSTRGIPQTYSLMGYPDFYATGEPLMQVNFRPAANVDYKVTIGGWSLIPEFTLDGQPDPQIPGDYMIGDWNTAIIEYAAYLVYRGAEDLSEAMSALADFNGQVLGLRKSTRRTYGPGVGSFPGSAVSDTIT